MRGWTILVIVVLGGWFLVEAAVLSTSKGIVHPYYVSALAPAHARYILTAVSDALTHIHARGILHRDIKPDNVLISSDGDIPRVWVSDFGIASVPLSDRGIVRAQLIR